MFGIYRYIDTADHHSPFKSELKYPVAPISGLKKVAEGNLRSVVFAALGRGKQDTERGLMNGQVETCWIWRVENREANEQGHFLLWEICFVDSRVETTGPFRQDF